MTYIVLAATALALLMNARSPAGPRAPLALAPPTARACPSQLGDQFDIQLFLHSELNELVLDLDSRSLHLTEVTLENLKRNLPVISPVRRPLAGGVGHLLALELVTRSSRGPAAPRPTAGTGQGRERVT